MDVSEIMTTDVQVVSTSDSLRGAAHLMDRLNVGSLPVCEDDRPVNRRAEQRADERTTAQRPKQVAPPPAGQRAVARAHAGP
ncbi:MAG: CBS domain-containing protein [Burkholderiales bacterium]|nr:CBS domain-containing protein [Burkholderiales bacterium]